MASRSLPMATLSKATLKTILEAVAERRAAKKVAAAEAESLAAKEAGDTATTGRQKLSQTYLRVKILLVDWAKPFSLTSRLLLILTLMHW
ncbi:hypothetical protein EMIT0324P_10498 [Pseudomonas chlororaphis]